MRAAHPMWNPDREPDVGVAYPLFGDSVAKGVRGAIGDGAIGLAHPSGAWGGRVAKPAAGGVRNRPLGDGFERDRAPGVNPAGGADPYRAPDVGRDDVRVRDENPFDS